MVRFFSKLAEAMAIQSHIWFTGTVQRVGFRVRTAFHANALRLTGWVRNLSDGRVEVLAEGKKEVILELIEMLEDEFTITQKEIRESTATHEFPDFRIER
jgi:acylphosphatase